MKYYFLVMFFLILILAACDERSTTLPPSELYGSLTLNFTDSFHLNELTDTLTVGVSYQITNPSGSLETGTVEIPAGGQAGDIHQLILNKIAAGALTLRYAVSRPFIIMGRKDDTSKARFSDSTSVNLLANGSIDFAPVEIWAYKLNQLIIYFDQDIDGPHADSIVESLGATVLGQKRSYIYNGLIYDISTDGLGPESDLKPIYEGIPGINHVNFNIIGQSFF